VELWVLFPKVGFPEKDIEIENLFEKRNFNETQKKVKCKILINYDEIREITLAELSQFINEIEEGKHSQYDIPFRFSYIELNHNIKKTVINNKYGFTEFLSYLYCFYRKIEIKLEKAGYLDILPELNSNEESFMKISINLDKAKEDYKSMNRNSFLEMYPVVKKLFLSYVNYVKYSIEHMSSMDEGDHLPGTIEEIKPLLEKLNVWSPVKVENQWINYINSIIIPPGYERVTQILRKTNKFKHFQIVIDDETQEPYIKDEYGKKTFFGVANMEGGIKEKTPHDAAVFVSQCPCECNNILRRWICIKCGEFILQKDDAVFCCCGSKRYKLLLCHHLNQKIKCRVFLDNRDVMEMNSNVILEFQENIQDRQYPGIGSPIIVYCLEMYLHFGKKHIYNESTFIDFLSYLYFIYRIIEVKMKNNGYPNILPNFESEEKLSIIYAQLLENKNAFQAVDKKDFLKMYPVVKKLFFSYVEYITCSIKLGSDIDEGEYLPGTVDELKSLFNQLATWFPININGEWTNCMKFFIVTPSGFEDVIQKLHKTTVFKDSLIIIDNKLSELYVGNENNRKIPFGFVDMQWAYPRYGFAFYTTFESECPEKCTQDVRKWICIKCGEFVTEDVTEYDTYLCCNCGIKEYREALLTCPHPRHQLKCRVRINYPPRGQW